MEKPDLLQAIKDQGFDPRKTGRTHRMPCPFHQERTASFYIYSNRWKCFGCQRGGDVYDFIRELKGLSFKEAVKYLGGEIEAPDREKMEKRKRVKAFRQWESEYKGAQLNGARMCDRRICNVQTTADMVEAAAAYHELHVLEYRAMILQSTCDDLKYELYKEVRDVI